MPGIRRSLPPSPSTARQTPPIPQRSSDRPHAPAAAKVRSEDEVSARAVWPARQKLWAWCVGSRAFPSPFPRIAEYKQSPPQDARPAAIGAADEDRGGRYIWRREDHIGAQNRGSVGAAAHRARRDQLAIGMARSDPTRCWLAQPATASKPVRAQKAISFVTAISPDGNIADLSRPKSRRATD
jgi:hypothetical protein